MFPTVGQVLDLSRAKLGDEDIGEAFGNDDLAPHLGTAYRTLIKSLDIGNTNLVTRRAYFVLPANTAAWAPAQSGVDDFGSPEEDGVRMAEIASQHTVIAVTLASDYADVQFSAAHGLSAGAQICLYGILGFRADRINDFWTVTTVPGADTVRLNGCVESGTYTSGGTGVVPSGEFGRPLQGLDDIRNLSRTNAVGVYSWTGGLMRFAPQTTAKLLEVAYSLSGDPPKRESSTIYIDDSLDFLSTYTAYEAAKSIGATQAAGILLQSAVGSDNDEDSRGGHLGRLLNVAIQALNANVYQAGRFRERRPRYGVIY